MSKKVAKSGGGGNHARTEGEVRQSPVHDVDVIHSRPKLLRRAPHYRRGGRRFPAEWTEREVAGASENTNNELATSGLPMARRKPTVVCRVFSIIRPDRILTTHRIPHAPPWVAGWPRAAGGLVSDWPTALSVKASLVTCSCRWQQWDARCGGRSELQEACSWREFAGQAGGRPDWRRDFAILPNQWTRRTASATSGESTRSPAVLRNASRISVANPGFAPVASIARSRPAPYRCKALRFACRVDSVKAGPHRRKEEDSKELAERYQVVLKLRRIIRPVFDPCPKVLAEE